MSPKATENRAETLGAVLPRVDNAGFICGLIRRVGVVERLEKCLRPRNVIGMGRCCVLCLVVVE